MHTSRDQLIFILRTLEPYWPLAHGLGVFAQSKYADEAIIHKLSGFIQDAIAAIRLSSISEKKHNATRLHEQGEIKKQQDLDKAEDLLSGLSALGQETLEQNQIDSNADKVVDANELRNLAPDLTSKERKKLAQSLSTSPEVQSTMLESCGKMYEELSAKIAKGELLTKEDIELFQLSVYMLGKNTDIVIDGVITPGKLTEQLVKEINPEYFRTRLLIERFGPECAIDINALWLSRPEAEREVIFEKVKQYRETLVRLRAEPDDMSKTLYNIFVQGINSHGKFDDKERFDELDARIRRAQTQLQKQEEIKAKQKAFQEKQQRILSIEKSIPALNEQLLQLGKDVEAKQKEYEGIYKQFAEVLKQNNTFREKAKAVSPYLLAVATGPLGPLIATLRSKSSLDTNEMQQLVLYEKLTQKYSEIVQLQNMIKKVRSSIEQKSKQQQCLYYEMIRDSGKRELAEQALINLINQYGDPIRKQYAADIQLYMQGASKITQALFTANRADLNAIIKQKNRAIDIAQQLMTGSKPQWGMMDVAGLQYLSQDDIGGIIGNEGLQQANMVGEMVAVRDNTANVRIIQTQEVVTDQGNRMGTKKGYETVGGTTSTQGNILYAQYQIAANQFKTLALPGLGSINVKIDPSLYNQIISFSEKNKQLTFDPVYNPELQCFEVNSSNVFITRVDKQGTIAYQARPGIGEPINYITRKEYQSLLQVKKGLANLVTEQAPIMEVLSYQEQLQQVATPIQQLAQLYSQTPGDALLSDTVIRDLTKSGGLKDQLTNLKTLLAKNGSYKTIITELKQNRSGVYDQYEKQLYDIEQMLQSLPSFVEQIDGLLNYSVWENADARTLKEFAITVAAIIGGVLLAVATGGLGTGVASSMVISAAAGSLGGMVSSRLAQEAFARGTDTGGLTNDLHSDIGKCIVGQAKWEDVLPQVGMEFAQGTATTLMFMGAGRIIGQQLEKFVTANAGVVSREVKVAHRVWKAISKLNDNEIQLLERKGFGKFVSKIKDELKEEFAQEGAQKGAEKLDPRLGTLVSIITSIGGKTQYRAGKVDVFMEGYDAETNATTVSYKGDADQLRSMLQENFDASGYTFDGTDPNGNLVYSQFVGDKVHRIIFTATQESTTIKEIDLPKHGHIYGIAFDANQTETDTEGNYHYTYNDLTVGKNNLTTYLARNGMIIDGAIAEDGSFTALAKNGEKIIFNYKPVEKTDSGSPVSTDVATNIVETQPQVDASEKVTTQQEVLEAQQQLDESITELEQELDAPVQDEKRIQNSFGRIIQSLRAQLQNAKGFVESAQQNPFMMLQTSIVRLYELISKRSPETIARSLSADSLRELSHMLNGFIVEYGLVIGPFVGILAVATTLHTKLQMITLMKLQQHMQEKLNKPENILLPTDKYGNPVYQTDAGVKLTPTQAIAVYKKNVLLANHILSAIPGAVFLIKTSFHLNSTTLLPSDVDVALNYQTGRQLVEYLISGNSIPETDNVVFEDTSSNPPQKIPLAHKRKLLAACEAGTLRIAYNTHVDGVTIEHELFVENNNKTLSVFDAQGKPLDTVTVDVDGVLVPHLGEKTAIKYLSELVDRGFDQLMDGSDTKGKFFKRLRDLGDTKNTLGYLNAVNVFINNIRSWIENKIGFKKGDEYQKQIAELRQSGKFKMLFDYIPANHPALNSPVELNRELDKDIHNLNEQCMNAFRAQDASGLGSALVQIEKLLQTPTASIDQLVHLAALKLLIVRNAPDVQTNTNADATQVTIEYDPLVLHNAAITDDSIRLSNIKQQLGMSEDQQLTQEQEQALLAAHYYNPKGQGVYGYDKRILIEKAWIAMGRYEIEVIDGVPRARLDEAGNLILKQGDTGAAADLISMQQAKDLIRSGLLGMPNPAKELSPAVVQEATDVLNGQEYTELSQELLLSLVPPRVYEVATNPENVRVMQYRNTNGTISLIVYEKDLPQSLSDEVAYAQRRTDVDAARQKPRTRLSVITPSAPKTVDRLHAKLSSSIDKGLLSLHDRVLMLCELSVFGVDSQMLCVNSFDGETRQGIGQDFYTSVLPVIARQLGMRFIVGDNHEGNISFFKETLGRYSRDQIKPEYRHMFGDKTLDSLFTIQFLYQEDVAKYVDEKYIRDADKPESIKSEFSLLDRQNITDKQSLESFLDKAFESYKSTPEYQLFAQVGMTKLVDQILMLRKNRLLTRYGDGQGSIDYFKAMQATDVESLLFDIGFVRFQERITDLESRRQLSSSDVATIVKDYFPHETLDLAATDSYNLSMLGDFLVKIQNIGIVKKQGLITAENERVVQLLANSGMFDVYFLDSYDLKELLSENTVEQLQAKLDQRIAYREEVLAIADDLGFDMAKYSITPGKFSLTYLRNLQKLKPIVYGNMRYLSLDGDAQNIINNLSDFDVQFAIKYNMDLMRLFAYVRTAKENTTLFRPEDLPGLERLFEQYKLSERRLSTYTLEQWLGSSDFNNYVLLYKAFGNSFESEWRNHYNQHASGLSVTEYFNLFSLFENSTSSSVYLHFMANYKRCGNARNYMLLYEKLGGLSNTNGWDRWLKLQPHLATEPGVAIREFIKLYELFGNDDLEYAHFVANCEQCGSVNKYLLLHERVGGIANVDGRNRRGEFSALESNVLSKTVEEFLLLYESFGNDKSKYEQYYSLVDRITQSPSGELQLIGGEVAKQLVGRENPMAILNQIIEIFEKNNLPEIGKQFRVFQILHSPQYLEQKIKGGEVFDPQLLELYGRTDINTAQKYQIAMDLFYADLLRIHIKSNNHQLRSYVEFMVEGEGLLSRYEGGQELSAQERKQLISRLQKLNTLYISSSATRNRSSGVDNQSISEENINDTIAQLRKQIGVGSGETISGKLVDIFVRPVGYSSFAELSTHMDSQQEQYHKRGEDIYRNAKLDVQGNRVLVLQEGDLINGFGGEGVPNYMERILQIGPAAKEFLGYGGSKSGDRTKLDADFIRVTSASQNDFNLFTKHGEVHGVFEANPDTIFETQVLGDDHVGVRTGLESGRLKFIRVQESVVNNPTQLSQLFACIAINGWYIPVCDPAGKIIFSPSDYQLYRNAFAGTKNGDQNILLSDKVMSQSLQDATAKLQQDMATDQESIAQKNRQLSSGITTVLAKYNIQTKQDDYDGDLSKALVLNTGSTGRGTNAPGDFDFDLAIGLTDAQIREHGEAIQVELIAFLGGEVAAGNKPGQIRITNSPEFGDVDILITRRNQFTEYYTHNAIEERLELIKREHGEEKYNAVRASIVLAKKLFKEAGVYKKTEGGMTGAGVENWILSHGGDIYAAALSFLETAKIYPSFQEFALHYLIVDPGVDLRSASRDNFLLLGNASQQSFDKMKAVCERIVSGDIGDVVAGSDNPVSPDTPTGGPDVAPTQTDQIISNPNKPSFDNLKGYTDAGYMIVGNAKMGPSGCKRITLSKEGQTLSVVQMEGKIIFQSSMKSLQINIGYGDVSMVILEPIGNGETNNIYVVDRSNNIILQKTGKLIDQGVGLYGIGEVINEEGDMQGTAYDSRGNVLNPVGYKLWIMDSSKRVVLDDNVYTPVWFERKNAEDISEYLKGIRNKNEQKREFPPMYPDLHLHKDGSVELTDATGNTRLTAIGEGDTNEVPNYFNGDKRNHFKFTTEQAATNSYTMDVVAQNPQSESLKAKAKQEILDTLKAKGIKLPEGFVVDDAFLDAIIKAHEITGGEGEGLGKFSLQTLLAKRRILDTYFKTRTDLTAEQKSDIARCLMEGGFCGKGVASILYYMIRGRPEYKDPNAGLPFEQRRAIAQQQLEQNGITDEQRSAYMPGLSEQLYDTVSPVNYNVGEKISQFMGYKEKYQSSDGRSDAWAMYLGLPQTHDTFDISEHMPAKSEDKGAVYFHLKGRDAELFNRFKHRLVTYSRLESAIATNDDSPYGKLLQEEYSEQYYRYKSTGKMSQNDNEVMGNFTMSTGVDPENGLHYVSYYDIWDLHPGGPLRGLGDRLPGKPFEIYGRIYYDPQTMQIIDPKDFSMANETKGNSRDDATHETPINDYQQGDVGNDMRNDSEGVDINDKTIDHQWKNDTGDNLIINHMLVKDRSSYDFEVINDLPQISNGLIQSDDPVAEMHILPLTKGMSAREYLSKSMQGLVKYQEYLRANIGKEGFPKFIVGISHLALMTKRFGFNIVDLNQDQIFKTRAYKTILNPENYGVRKEMRLQFKAFFSTQAATEYKDYQMYKKMFERFEPTDVRLSYISTEEFLSLDFSQWLPN